MITLKSKTHIWAMLKGIIGTTLLAVPNFREFLPMEAYGVILAIFTMIDIILRNVTTQPVGDK